MRYLSVAILACGALVAASGPAVSQDLVFDPGALSQCVAGADTPVAAETCIGIASGTCMERTQGGYSTVGMAGCLDAELGWWDAMLNVEYKRLIAEHKITDAEMADAGHPAVPMAAALRDMQRAWIGYRDAACAYEAAQWGGGTGAGPAALGCLLQVTAEQAISLSYSGLE